MALLEGLLPAAAVVVETREDRLDIALFPEEERALGRAVEKRRREFITGRACAREALARLGLPPAPIGSGSHGEPLWPAGVVGSITHCEGYRACAVARASDLCAIGIDAEPDAPLPPGMWETVAHGRERELETGAGAAQPHLDRLLFSIKEAIYKAWFPATGVSLGFEDVEVSIDVPIRSFRARLRQTPAVAADRPLADIDGRWDAADGIIVSAVAVHPSLAASPTRCPTAGAPSARRPPGTER
jgi:4'-phosphopantetheinyl transferase EntD